LEADRTASSPVAIHGGLSMTYRKVGYLVVGLVMALLGVRPAAAAKHAFSIDPYGVRAVGATRNLGTGGVAGVALASGSQDQFGFGFAVPRGYIKNSPIRIIFNWQTQGTSCGIVFEPEFLDRSRTGHASTGAFAPTDGLAAEDGMILLNATTTVGQGNTKVFTLVPGQGFDQVTGDAITMAFFRDGFSASDTCTDDLIISGITIEYRTP